MLELVNCGPEPKNKTVQYLPLSSSFIASVFVHFTILLVASALISDTSKLITRDLISVSLVERPHSEKPMRTHNEQKSADIKKPAPLRAGTQENRAPIPKSKREPAAGRAAPTAIAAPPRDEAALPRAADPPPPSVLERRPPGASAKLEAGGSEREAGYPYHKGDVGIFPDSGTAAGGRGTAVSGLGRDSAGSGLPAPTTPLRASREAKPLQTVRASYPPMALRMGLEGDVTLKIEVDPEGTVTKAEIIKSGGTGFDEEALKAVKQSRFEPAQSEGQKVRAEFTYVYRFRLKR